MRTTYFERAIFLSWYCSKADCKFCYMSTQKNRIKEPKRARRTKESILAEAILCKQLGWKIEFLSSGYESYAKEELLFLIRNIKKLYGKKLWLNIGTLNEKELKLFKPYTEGICGAVECINQKIRKKLCPSKPLKEIENMFILCNKLKLKKAITIILGVGETINDFELLKNFIKKHNINKITFYRLKPQKNTIFDKIKPIKTGYYVKWIKKTRKAFPRIHITVGSWLTHLNEIHLLLNAGADSITKFPSIKLFNTKYAKIIEQEAKKANRKFVGTLTRKPKFKINILNNLKIDRILKNKINIRLDSYLKKMS